MPYLIPQELKYKEKILFGLTAEQLLYSLLFLPAVAIFKTNLSIEAKIMLALIPLSLAVLLMFFNLGSWIKNQFNFWKFRKLSIEDEKQRKRMQKFLKLSSVNEYINTDKKVAIISVEPINYSIRDEKEQKISISLFQKFLNSLDFPIQILIQTKKIDINAHLKPIKDKEYREHILKKTSNVSNRIFYIAIRETGDINIQISIILERLKALNLNAEIVKEAELKQIITTALSSFSSLHLSESLPTNPSTLYFQPSKVTRLTRQTPCKGI